MSSFSMDVKSPVSEVFSEVQQCIGKANYNVTSIVPDKMVIAEGKREFSWGIVIVLVLFVWPGAILYYFSHQKSNVTATFTRDNENEYTFTITSNGKKGDNLIDLVKHVFQENNKVSEPQLKTQNETQFWVCPKCGGDTQMKDTKQYCPSCKEYL